MQPIDWNEVWKELRAQRTVVQKSASSWGTRSCAARRMVRDDLYVDGFLAIMEPQPDWTVFDMGSGPGTLAVPLAPLVARITAADFSQAMLDALTDRCTKGGITNITAKKLAWEDDWQAAGIEQHDVMIASRSLVSDDLREAIIKIDRTARKKVFVSTIVNDGPFDRRVFEAIGRPLHVGPDYICNYNLLHQMGIFANVNMIRQAPRRFESRSEAFESLSWMMDSMTEEEKNLLDAFLDKHLVQDGDDWVTDYEFNVTWAVLWWEK